MYEYRAKYLGNYDGDTVTFEVDLGFKIKHTIKVRIRGINTPELRTQDPELFKKAVKAKEYVEDVLSNEPIIIIRTLKDRTEKYGRYLADILYGPGSKNLGLELMHEQLATSYLSGNIE